MPAAVTSYRRPVWVVGLEASALTGRSGTGPGRIRPSPRFFSSFSRRRVCAPSLALAEGCVSSGAEGRLKIGRAVIVRVRQRGSRRARGGCGERGHRRRARECGLAGAARGICSWRRALAIAAFLYPQGPDGRDDGCLRVGVVSQEELLLGAALLARVHGFGWASGVAFARVPGSPAMTGVGLFLATGADSSTCASSRGKGGRRRAAGGVVARGLVAGGWWLDMTLRHGRGAPAVQESCMRSLPGRPSFIGKGDAHGTRYAPPSCLCLRDAADLRRPIARTQPSRKLGCGGSCSTAPPWP